MRYVSGGGGTGGARGIRATKVQGVARSRGVDPRRIFGENQSLQGDGSGGVNTGRSPIRGGTPGPRSENGPHRTTPR
jgi:hypothetical protein